MLFPGETLPTVSTEDAHHILLEKVNGRLDRQEADVGDSKGTNERQRAGI